MLIAVFAAVAVAGAHAEDRTYNTLTSGLSQLINPGPQGPYSAPQPENTYGLPAEHQVWSVTQTTVLTSTEWANTTVLMVLLTAGHKLNFVNYGMETVVGLGLDKTWSGVTY